jgi:hypothetical protein
VQLSPVNARNREKPIVFIRATRNRSGSPWMIEGPGQEPQEPLGQGNREEGSFGV